MGDKAEYDKLYEQYLKQRRIYLSNDVEQALKDDLTDLKLRLEAYGNGEIPDFNK